MEGSCDLATDELMAMCAIQGPARVERGGDFCWRKLLALTPDEFEESCL